MRGARRRTFRRRALRRRALRRRTAPGRKPARVGPAAPPRRADFGGPPRRARGARRETRGGGAAPMAFGPRRARRGGAFGMPSRGPPRRARGRTLRGAARGSPRAASGAVAGRDGRDRRGDAEGARRAAGSARIWEFWEFGGTARTDAGARRRPRPPRRRRRVQRGVCARKRAQRGRAGTQRGRGGTQRAARRRVPRPTTRERRGSERRRASPSRWPAASPPRPLGRRRARTRAGSGARKPLRRLARLRAAALRLVCSRDRAAPTAPTWRTSARWRSKRCPSGSRCPRRRTLCCRRDAPSRPTFRRTSRRGRRGRRGRRLFPAGRRGRRGASPTARRRAAASGRRAASSAGRADARELVARIDGGTRRAPSAARDATCCPPSARGRAPLRRRPGPSGARMYRGPRGGPAAVPGKAEARTGCARAGRSHRVLDRAGGAERAAGKRMGNFGPWSPGHGSPGMIPGMDPRARADPNPDGDAPETSPRGRTGPRAPPVAAARAGPRTRGLTSSISATRSRSHRAKTATRVQPPVAEREDVLHDARTRRGGPRGTDPGAPRPRGDRQ